MITMILAGFSLILAVWFAAFTVLSLFGACKNVGETRAVGQT
jgi:hypothetical protein